VYDEKTRPLVDFYRARGLLRVINAEGDVSEVTRRLGAAIGAPVKRARPARAKSARRRRPPRRPLKAASRKSPKRSPHKASGKKAAPRRSARKAAPRAGKRPPARKGK
jgi:hypothetical protein